MSDPQVRRFKWGRGGPATAFGLWFLLFGVPMFVLVLDTSPSRSFPPVVWTFFLLFGGGLSVWGAVLVLGRKGITIDLRRRIIAKWVGPLVPFHVREFPLEGFGWVQLSKEIRGRRSNKPTTVYAVYLEKEGKRIEFRDSEDYETARSLAEAAAKFAGLGIRDLTSDPPGIREAGTLDEFVIERLRREGRRPEHPGTPEYADVEVNWGGPGEPTSLVVGANTDMALGGWTLLLVVAGLCLAVYAWFSLYLGVEDKQKYAQSFSLSGILIIAIGAAVCTRVTQGFTRERIVVGPRHLELHRHGIFGEKVETVALTAIEEVVVESDEPVRAANPGDAGGGTSARAVLKELGLSRRLRVLLRTDQKTLAVGANLADRDRIWLRNAILYALDQAA